MKDDEIKLRMFAHGLMTPLYLLTYGLYGKESAKMLARLVEGEIDALLSSVSPKDEKG